MKATPEREGRNPSTGATIKIAAAKKLTFVPARARIASIEANGPCLAAGPYLRTLDEG